MIYWTLIGDSWTLKLTTDINEGNPTGHNNVFISFWGDV